MAPQVAVPAAKRGSLSSVPRTQMIRREKYLSQVVLTLPQACGSCTHTHTHQHAHTHTHTHTHQHAHTHKYEFLNVTNFKKK
jgi:ABC-type Zn2+ transport system substrate-binding protein/surface adhesin